MRGDSKPEPGLCSEPVPSGATCCPLGEGQPVPCRPACPVLCPAGDPRPRRPPSQQPTSPIHTPPPLRPRPGGGPGGDITGRARFRKTASLFTPGNARGSDMGSPQGVSAQVLIIWQGPGCAVPAWAILAGRSASVQCPAQGGGPCGAARVPTPHPTRRAPGGSDERAGEGSPARSGGAPLLEMPSR